MSRLRFLGRKYTLEELYDRQMRIEGFDQRSVCKATVGIIGGGATGSHAGIYSAHVGVGRIRLCDFDRVEAHNVPRMMGITLKDVGKNKADALANAIRRIGNKTKVEVYKREASSLPNTFFDGLDVAIICVDRISTRFVVGDILWSRNIPHIDVGIQAFLLNVMVFLPERKEWPCMFCMRQIIPERQIQFSNTAKSCDEKPIPTILPPGAVASAIAVSEALKILTDFRLGEPLNNFLQIDLRSFIFLKLKIPKDKDCTICGKSTTQV